jgi:hypothetical protein
LKLLQTSVERPLAKVEKSVILGSERVCFLAVMYCPQCKAEYRQGFTRCADCEVELVYEPPQSAPGWGSSSEPGGRAEEPEDPFCSFWRGDDPRIHAELCELLNEEGIPHKTVRREDHLFHLNTKSAFEIGIPFSQFDKAEAAIKAAYGAEEEQQDPALLLPYAEGYAPGVRGVFPWRPLAKGFARAAMGCEEEPESVEAATPEEREADEQAENPSTDWDPTEWDPEEATVQVWSDKQSYLGEMIEMALRENQIHARFERGNGRNAVYVMPEDEIRAREIVREVVESAPPK